MSKLINKNNIHKKIQTSAVNSSNFSTSLSWLQGTKSRGNSKSNTNSVSGNKPRSLS